MKKVWFVLGWFFSILFFLLIVSMLMLSNWIQALVLFLVLLLTFPPFIGLIRRITGRSVHPILRVVLIFLLLAVFIKLLIGGDLTSIYKSTEIKNRFREIYNEKMKDWPVPYSEIYVDSKYGKIHIIVSGPEKAPPALLLHASGVASWSWKYNIEGLSQKYRCYAIDLIGDVGKSEFTNLNNILKTGRDQAELYTEITNQLGVDKAFVIGASEGGFIASNYALYNPERVEKLVLLGPMGYAGATQSVIRIMFAQFFPLKPIQESTFSWAFSDNPMLKAEFSEWFPLLMTGYNPAKVMPLPFSSSERQKLEIPVMFIFGARDNLVGDPKEATALVQDIPNVKVKVVQAGHLMAAEKPDLINKYVMDFF